MTTHGHRHDHSNRSTHSRPGSARVLATGASRLIDDVASMLAAPVLRTQNLFDAMGELSAATPEAPFVAMLMPESVALASTHEALRGMKAIDPAVPLILVSESESTPVFDRHDRSVFDGVVTTPLTRNEVEDTIGCTLVDESEMNAQSAAQTAERVETIASDARDGETGSDTDAPNDSGNDSGDDSGTGSDDDGNGGSMVVEVELSSLAEMHDLSELAEMVAEQSSSTPASAAEAQERYGDIDLVRAIRSGDGTLLPIAMELIRQQTGWTDVQFHTGNESGENAPAAHGTSVLEGDVQFGVLSTEQASSDARKAWAEWLAQWIGLDRAFQLNAERAYRDDLTSAFNRRYFEQYLERAIERARHDRRPVSVMMFDIDDFKQYNDQYGHDAGDQILIETVRFLQTVIRKTDRVCRIGGDEFAVIFDDPKGPRKPGSMHPDTVTTMARRFQREICTMRFPKLGPEAPGTLTVSAGLATYPWDGRTPAELLQFADRRAMQSKQSGKNRITFGQEAGHDCSSDFE